MMSRTLGRWPVRLLAIGGCVLIVLAAFGFWLDSRVLSDQGFADVVAKASQKQPVRDYVADQATLRLSSSSNFVSGARPIVTDAISSAIATPPVEDAIRDFAQRAHQQVFQVRAQRRVDVDAQEASTTVRAALQSINPAMAKKLPANVLEASTTITQNSLVDTLLDVSNWIWLWVPVGLFGIALLFLAMIKARDRVHAIRVVGTMLAVSGALLAGVGLATPFLSSAAATTEPGRGEAIAAFVEVLLGRLVGAGLALVLVGLAIALAPGKDGGDIPSRVRRYREFWVTKWESPRWRFGIGIGIAILAALFLTQPGDIALFLVQILAFVAFYVGVIIALRATGLLVTDHAIARMKKRHVVGVFAAMIGAGLVTATVVTSAVAANVSNPSANPTNQGCNGYIELCDQPLDQVVWPASHNAMSSSAYNFFGAEHTVTVPEQLNGGARFLMLDAYYGYDDNGIVRTNLAGGISRQELEKDRGEDTVRALNRLGALTGTADTSGKKQDVYFCHDFCELGAVKATDVFDGIRDFLDRNLTDVVILDFEDYVKAKDMRKAMEDADLFDRVLTLSRHDLETRTLRSIIVPKNPKAEQAKRRLIVVSEKHGGEEKWLPSAYGTLWQETPFTFSNVADFSCKPKRGNAANPMFLINHWLRPNGPPDPVEAAHVNSLKVLTKRFTQCATQRNRLPNAVAVDFTSLGDFNKAVNRFNAAVATVTGDAKSVDRIVKERENSGTITPAEEQDLSSLRRLPHMSMADAIRLLGPVAGTLEHPVLDPNKRG